MKKFTKTLATTMAAAMLATCTAGMATTLFASASDYTITISDADKHDFSAYQIFDGDYDATSNVLSNIVWGSNIGTKNGAALITALQDITDDTHPLYEKFTSENCSSAADVAVIISDTTFTNEQLRALATFINKGNYLTGTAKKVGTDEDKKTIIDVEDAGYYLLVDNKDVTDANNAKSAYIMQVLGAVRMASKSDNPTIEKKIKEDNSLVDGNIASIGDTVTYTLTVNLPKAERVVEYEGYYLTISDNLSKGLTFGSITSVEGFKEDGSIIDKNNDNSNYYVYTDDSAGNSTEDKKYKYNADKYSETDGTTFTLDFSNLEDDIVTGGVEKIVVTYTATLNDKAVIGGTGNPNEVELIYSNDPTYDQGGDKKPDNPPNWPDSNTPKGKTPKDIVKTFTSGIQLTKVDGTNTSKTLAGATFEISGEKLNKVVKITQSFVLDDNGTYWKLKNGQYTETDPSTQGIDTSVYDSTTQKYKLNVAVSETAEKDGDSKISATVGDDGILKVNGLNEGTYTITETQAPSGYNKLTTPIKLVIDGTVNVNEITGAITCAWSIGDGTTGKGETPGMWSVDNDTAIYSATIKNNKGSLLPETGGIGTTIFYAGGTFMLLGAAGLYLNKKRKNAQA